jgi:hypothetical protein
MHYCCLHGSISKYLQLLITHPASILPGIPAVLGRDLVPHDRPHWMGNKRKDSYHSTTIIGQLYDEVTRSALFRRQSCILFHQSSRNLDQLNAICAARCSCLTSVSCKFTF